MLIHPIPSHLRTFARQLRSHMTPEERHLWFDKLHDYPVRIRRQVILGNHIVDFCCEKARLIIELDGSQHYEPEEKQKDLQRTRDLEDLGYQVLRFSNRDIHQHFEAVGEMIHETIQKRLEENKKKYKK